MVKKNLKLGNFLKMNKSIKQNVLPLISACIWGTAFVVQDTASSHVSPFAFNALRSIVAVIFLLMLTLILKNFKSKEKIEENKNDVKSLIIGGIMCGSCLFLATNLQQIGITKGTSGGKAGFITAIYMVIVPIIGIFLKKKNGLNVLFAVVLALVGLYLLCITNGFNFAVSDLYVLGCAFAFAIHILVIDYYGNKTDGIMLSLVQFFVNAVLSSIFCLIFEIGQPFDFSKIIGAILFVGILSSGVAYTLQIIAQKGTNPTIVSILLSTESFFAIIAQAIITKEFLTLREYVGCAIILLAVLLTQINFTKKNN